MVSSRSARNAWRSRADGWAGWGRKLEGRVGGSWPGVAEEAGRAGGKKVAPASFARRGRFSTR